MTAYLPEKIFLYCKKPEDLVNYFDDDDEEETFETTSDVRHAFPVSDQSSQARHDNAKEWSTVTEYPDGYQKPCKKIEGDVFEYSNNSFDNVTIKSLDIRGQGGRAYQVILEHDDKKFQVDLREGTLLDVIRNTGIQVGGRLNGSFCFIVEGSQTNLVREHSKIWQDSKKGAETRKTSTLKKSDLKIGHKYKSLSGDTAIYLGEVYSRTISIKNNKLEYGKLAKKMVFIDVWEDQEMEEFKKGNFTYYRTKIQTSQSYREDLGKVGDITSSELVSALHKIGEETYREHTKNKISGSYSETALKGYEMIELSETKDITIDLDKINKVLQLHKDYYNARPWWR